MKLAIKTCTLDMSYEDMLDFCAAQGISGLEIGTGNWSSAPHIDLDEMLSHYTPPSAAVKAVLAGAPPGGRRTRVKFK